MRSVLCLVLLAVGCGSGSLNGAWKSGDGQFSLKFDDTGHYFQWDTRYPPASLTAVDPSGNPSGAKIYGTFTTTENEIAISGRDGLTPSATETVKLSSSFSIDADTLTAPGLVQGVSSYLRAQDAP